MHNLFEILKGDPFPKSRIQFAKTALKQLELIQQKMQDAKVKHINYLKSCSLIILKTSYTLTACLWEQGLLECMYLTHTQIKMKSYLFYV